MLDLNLHNDNEENGTRVANEIADYVSCFFQHAKWSGRIETFSTKKWMSKVKHTRARVY